MVIKKSTEQKDVLPLVNQFIGNKPLKNKGWFLVISSPDELTIRKSGGRSVMELEGLGKEIWEGIDVEKYISEERKAWN